MSEGLRVSGYRCGLCGHDMELGNCGMAIVGGIHLCHVGDHDCYREWTVYGKRPAAIEGDGEGVPDATR